MSLFLSSQMHYSFNYGNAHYISLDTETGYPGAPEEHRYIMPCGGFAEQLQWLERDLQAASTPEQRLLRPWIFVQGHHPMYQGASTNVALQSAFESLFHKYGVDVFFTGHNHWYERNAPVYQGVPDASYDRPKGTVHVLVGGAGNDEMHHVPEYVQTAEGDSTTLTEGDGKWRTSEDNGPWTMFVDKDDNVGMSTVHVIDDNSLVFQYVRTKTGEIMDSFTLVRDHSIYPLV